MTTTGVIPAHSDRAELPAQQVTSAEMSALYAATGLLFLTGLYLAISPWVVGFTPFVGLTGNDLIVGIALAVVSLGLGAGYGRARGLAWVMPLLGAWTIIAPWVVNGAVATTATIWSNVVAGAIAVVIGLVAMSLRTIKPAEL